MPVSVVIIARTDFMIPTWEEAWPDALRLPPGDALPTAQLAVILAGDTGWTEAARHYHQHRVPVLVCSREATIGELREAMQAGARGYLDLFSSADVLQRAAATVMQGALWIPPTLLDSLIGVIGNALPEPHSDPFSGLSVREQQVARAVVKGLSNKAVANELAISERTVKLHLTSIFSKLGVSDRMQLLLLSRTPH